MENPDYSEVFELDPEGFEWLDLAEEFFKHDGSFSFGEERNSRVFRAGRVYQSIEREWDQLNALYEVCPEHIVEPLMPIYVEREEGDREIAGFYVERFEGENLQDYILNSEDIAFNHELIEEVEDMVKHLHSEGVVHGDLANNGIFNGENFKFHDPVGKPYDREGYQNMLKWDEEDIEVLRNKSDPFDDYTL